MWKSVRRLLFCLFGTEIGDIRGITGISLLSLSVSDGDVKLYTAALSEFSPFDKGQECAKSTENS
ncbi:hypothetical protein CDO73_04600 [Saccharibacillus sp. O23]|nr:hypothetical protein CDO73_04600 [Saccharibacillus sp. O23]